MFLVLVMQKRLGFRSIVFVLLFVFSYPLPALRYIPAWRVFVWDVPFHCRIFLRLFLFFARLGKKTGCMSTAGNFFLREGMEMGRKQIGFIARVSRMAFSKHWLLFDDGYDFHLFLATLMALSEIQ